MAPNSYVVRLAQDAVTEVRRAQARELNPKDRVPIKNARWALLKNAENLRASEKAKAGRHPIDQHEASAPTS